MSATPTRGLFGSDALHRAFGRSRLLRTWTIGAMARLELAVLAGHKAPGALADIRAARRGRESLLGGNEAFTVYSLARSQAALPGAMAEVGVYEGVSARLISLGSGGRELHLFDTFAGLPAPEGGEEGAKLRAGQYAASLPSVQAYLADRPDVRFHPGLFPESAGAAADLRFSFVHLDVDLESSTRGCLEFFYPRMAPGGVILSHDFSYLPGVRRAFTTFLEGRPEAPIELATSQVMVVKQARP